MPNFGNPAEMLTADAFTVDTTPKHQIGMRAQTRDGRAFRYVKVGASALVAGNAVQGPATVANHLALTPSAASISALQVVATLGATAAAANDYADGWVQIDTTPGNGFMYSISGHAAVVSSGVLTANLYPDDSVQVALTSSSRVGFIPNPHNGVIQLPVTTATGTLVGVAVYPIAAASYGWIQTWGPAAVLIAGTPALGALVMSPGTAAGAAVVITTTNLIVAQIVGSMMQVGVDGRNNAVFVKIQP